MTMQVGMVGTDGILIASDTKWVASPPLAPNRTTGTRNVFGASKIVIDRDKGIVAAYARNMEVSRVVATEVLTLEEKDWAYPISPIEAIGDRALKSCGARNDAHCLIAFARPVPQLFLFCLGTRNGEPAAICQNMQTTAISGDNANSAIFWSDRYYQKMPIERLAPLAAHLVLSAGKLNTAMISGLEIVLLDSNGIRHVSDKSIEELQLKSEQWDKSIGEMILTEQQLTYAPDVIG